MAEHLNTVAIRTPCVGRCSTTYGDLVCKGCKRFTHEIVNWNGYEPNLKQRVIARIAGLTLAVLGPRVVVADTAQCAATATALRLPEDAALWRRTEADAAWSDTTATSAYRLMFRTVRSGRGTAAVSSIGLASAVEDATLPNHLAGLLAVIDQELLLRSEADYERSFRVLVR